MLDCVESSAVSFEGRLGLFFMISEGLMFGATSKTHTRENFVFLAQNNNPIVRAMGLHCLARTDKHSAQILKSHLKDTSSINCLKGCISRDMTIGEFPRELLHNAYFLGHNSSGSWQYSLELVKLTDHQLICLDIEILANKDYMHLHGEAIRTLTEKKSFFKNLDLENDSPNLPRLIEKFVSLVVVLL